MYKIIFIMTNYNNSNFTETAVKSIGALGLNTFIIIVDNASNVGDKENLRQLECNCSNLKIIFNENNVGYFEGLNVGIRFALNSNFHFDYMVIGNNDLEFPKDFFSKISNVHHLFDKYPIISPNILTLDGVHQNPFVVRKIGKFREFMYSLYFSNYYLAQLISYFARIAGRLASRKDFLQHNVAQEVEQGFGACYVLGPLFFKHFKQLFAPTFLMHEEFFLSYQLKEKGFKIFYEPSIVVRHHYHAARKSIPSKQMWLIAKKSFGVYRRYVKL